MPWQLDHHMNACRNKTQKKQTRRQKIDAKRFYTSQWDDLWGYVLDNPGSVIDGNDGHNYRMVSPSWNGTVPAGFTRVVQGESDLLGTLTRTQLIGGETDLPRLKEIQQSYKLRPPSKFLAVFQFFLLKPARRKVLIHVSQSASALVLLEQELAELFRAPKIYAAGSVLAWTAARSAKDLRKAARAWKQRPLAAATEMSRIFAVSLMGSS